MRYDVVLYSFRTLLPEKFKTHFQIDTGGAMFGDSLRKYLQNNRRTLSAKAENGRYFGYFVLL